MRHPPPKALLDFLEPFNRPIRELALATRSLVLEEMAPCAENIYDAYSAVALGYGSSDRLKDGVNSRRRLHRTREYRLQSWRRTG